MGYEKAQRPIAHEKGDRQGVVTPSTAASTALDPRGLISLQTTSTGAPVVYTLSRVPHRGDEFYLHATDVGSSSDAPFHVNAASGSFFGSSSEDMLSLGAEGSGAHVIGLSTTRWAVVGANDVSFSTST